MKSSKYKALIVDLDGTLIANKKGSMPSKKVIKTVNEASKKIHIGIATAKPIFLLHDILDCLKLSGPSIVNGGSQIIDAQSRTIIREQPIKKKDFWAVRNILESLAIPFFFNDDGIDYTPDQKDYILNKPFQICTMELTPRLADHVLEHLSHIPTIAVHKFLWQKAETEGVIISHKSATKQHGISEVANILGITTKEIIGIGDGYNDFPLLMACGLKVAMGNAVDDLKAIADYIAPTVEEDGVANVIEKFILNKD